MYSAPVFFEHGAEYTVDQVRTHINDSFMCRVYHQYVTSSSCSTDDFIKDELKQNWMVMLFVKPLWISKPMRTETQNDLYHCDDLSPVMV